MFDPELDFSWETFEGWKIWLQLTNLSIIDYAADYYLKCLIQHMVCKMSEDSENANHSFLYPQHDVFKLLICLTNSLKVKYIQIIIT